jgi:hypothetical protein
MPADSIEMRDPLIQFEGGRQPARARAASAHNGQPLPGTETTLESNTNAPEPPAPAIDRPHAVAPVFIVMSWAASMLPWNSE